MLVNIRFLFMFLIPHVFVMSLHFFSSNSQYLLLSCCVLFSVLITLYATLCLPWISCLMFAIKLSSVHAYHTSLFVSFLILLYSAFCCEMRSAKYFLKLSCLLLIACSSSSVYSPICFSCGIPFSILNSLWQLVLWGL